MSPRKFYLIGVLIIFMACSISAAYGQNTQDDNYTFGRELGNQRTGERGNVYLINSRIFLQQFDLENALFELDNAVAYDPNDADAYLQRALLKYKLGMTTEAKRDLDKALRLNPYVADLYGYNGKDNQLQLLDFEPLSEAESLTFEDRLTHYWDLFGDQYKLKAGKTGENLEKLAQIIEHMEAEKWALAMEEVDKILLENPKSATAHDLSGLISKELGDLTSAERSFRKAIKHQPDFAIAWYNLSRVKMLQGERQEAREYLDQALDLQDDLAKAYYDRALLKKQAGDPEGAIADYDKVLSLNKELYSQAYLNRAMTRKILGDYSGAINDLNQIIEQNPYNPEYLKNRGNLYLVFGEINLAIADYTKALLLDDNMPSLYYNRGIAHILNFDLASACNDLDMAIKNGYRRAIDKQKYFCQN